MRFQSLINNLFFSLRFFLAALLLSIVAGDITAAESSRGSPITLVCKYEMVSHFWGSQYTCIGQDVVVNTYDTFVTRAVGTHLAGMGDGDVQAVFFKNQKMTFIPLMMSTPFPNLNALRVDMSGLTTINQTTFVNQGRLRYIHLDNNRIEFIPKKTFYNLTNLEWLSLGANKISALNPDMLRGLTELKYFSVSNNEIEVIGSSFFRDNVKIQIILFYNNKLRMIGWSLVRFLPGLKNARFDGNVCTNINIIDASDISDQLTSEFSQKCSVSCSKAFNAANNKIEKLMGQRENLKRTLMKNKMEKQSMTFDCIDAGENKYAPN